MLSCATAVAGGANASLYCNKDVDAAAAAALAEQDDAKRLAMYQDIQKQIMADAPWVPTTLSETVELVLGTGRRRTHSIPSIRTTSRPIASSE